MEEVPTYPKATERPETTSDAKEKCQESEGVGRQYARSPQYKGALETITEDAPTRSGQFSAVIGQVSTSQARTDAQNAEDDEERTKGKNSTQHYERMVTDEELDVLERGGDRLVKNEPEGYEKELEEGLFPMNEEEILLRAKRNAYEHRKPTLATMSAELVMPEAVLERTREVSSGDLGTPAYWLDWNLEDLEIEDIISTLRDKEGGISLDEDSLREHLVDVGGTLSESFQKRALV
ncbi:hypothetical protein PInf_025093 [Phytophthora infestans]|nr:hypothetical protein PInf_025093 [Phytophthora infestans]